MEALTREQKEYVKLKAAFERMYKVYDKFRRIDGNQCIPILSKHTVPEAEYVIETVFNNLLDNFKHE